MSHRFCVVINESPLLGGRRITVCQCLHECDNLIFLLAGKSKVTELPSVHRFGMFGRRPTAHLLSGIASLALWERVAGIIKVDHFLERFQVAVVHVGLDEIRARPLIDVSQGGCLMFAYEGFRPRRPLSIDRKSTRLNSSHLVISYA